MEKFYQRRIPPTAIITPEVARQLTELSREVHRQIGLLIDRGGHIQYVVVGDAHEIVLPDLKRGRASGGRFRGLRCVHTHLNGEGLTQDDLADLALLRLDLMTAIEVTEAGLPALVRSAHLMPIRSPSEAGQPAQSERPWLFLDPVYLHQLDVDFLQLIGSLEEEFARNRRPTHAQDDRERAILVGVTTNGIEEARDSMDELHELAVSCGLVVLDTIIQRRKQIDPRFLLGKGKLHELVIRALQHSADVIVFDQDLTPAQVRSIHQATDLKVIDRTQLILDIFAQRAQSREGKLQVELAQLKYLLPRLTDEDTGLSRLTGGIGGRGPGETKLEVDRRRVRRRIGHLEELIQQVRRQREARRSQRRRHDVPVVSIVGYTNAGKSTLLNTLTHSRVLAEERMFATLDPLSRRLRLPKEREIIICDTVGFIRNLPPDLINAFRATLEEIADSDLLIHLVDASSPHCEQRIESVERTLRELALQELPRLLVFNKMDRVPADIMKNLCRLHQAIAISALQPETLTELLDRIEAMLGHRGARMDQRSNTDIAASGPTQAGVWTNQ
ncbi:MAG: GTPase HflX [Acidobacteriota bacterium]|nr:GTPase HflX [Blastocatellia bacterium]MDW8239130.1 GTPase HflX [Acidobacteriota bacterium]